MVKIMVCATLNNETRSRPESFGAHCAVEVAQRAGSNLLTEGGKVAGDWIKMRHDLTDDPAVIKLAETTTCVDECHVVGVLHKLWCWVDRQSRNGHALGVTRL
jgi:hypothetical protein